MKHEGPDRRTDTPASAASRLVTFVLPALCLAAQPQFQIVQLWYVSVISVTLQAALSLWLARGELRRWLSNPASVDRRPEASRQADAE